jgi:hypothetical protein
MCGATCLPANFCFSELASKYPVQHVDLVQTRYYHHLIEKYFLLSMKLQKMAHLELSKNCSKEQCCVLCGELENTNFIVFDLTRGWIKPMICDETEFPP